MTAEFRSPHDHSILDDDARASDDLDLPVEYPVVDEDPRGTVPPDTCRHHNIRVEDD